MGEAVQHGLHPQRIRMIAEREVYHARIFERRMRDLSPECKAAPVMEEGGKFTEYLSNNNVSDKQKLLYFNSLVSDIEPFSNRLPNWPRISRSISRARNCSSCLSRMKFRARND